MHESKLKTCLVINETGWGNGVLELPFIVAIGQSFDRIIHTRSPFLESFGPKCFAPCWERIEIDWTSDEWKDSDWLSDLIGTFHVQTVINLRNEDIGHEWYRIFALTRSRSSNVQFWDLLDQYTGSDPYIQARWSAMFQSHGLQPQWQEAQRLLRAFFRSVTEDSDVLICSGASREDKAVAPPIWVEVATSLVREKPNLKLRLLNGTADHDQACGKEIARLLESRCIEFSVCCPNDVAGLINELLATSVVAANDSFLMHLAHALRIPTLGLFSVTNRHVWGNKNSNIFRSHVSDACSSCAGVMPTQGVCWRQPACPSIPNLSWDSKQLTRDILYLLSSSCLD